MILVDTDVWSEAFRPVPDPRVRVWAADNASRLWLSTVVAAELLSGIELMPHGQRRARLERGYLELIASYSDRIATFDLEAARQYAVILGLQERHGRNPGTADTQIAATALACGMALATRNTKHFAGLGLEIIDPWQA